MTTRPFLIGLSLSLCLSACGSPQTLPDKPTTEHASITEEKTEVTPPAMETTPETPAHRFVQKLSADQYDAAHAQFDATMAGAMSKEQLQEMWEGLEISLGPFQGIERTSESDDRGFHIVRITCRFQAAPYDLKIVLGADQKISGLWLLEPESPWSPPSYADPDRFTEREVTVGSDEWALPGTLTIPTGEGPFPAVVLVHGSGPNDRDEKIGPNRPFKDLAWGLASKGVAVVRFEKRTRHHAKKFTPQLIETITIVEESVTDPLRAADLLRTVPQVDKTRIFVAGHSQGGMAIPRIARGDANLAGFIIMAAPTRPLEDVGMDQFKYIFGLDGSIDSDEQAKLDVIRAQFDRVKKLQPGDKVPREQLPLGIPTSFWLDLKANPTAKLMAGETRPVLVLQGERDYQVTMAEFDGWKTVLGQHPNVRLTSYPKGNHLFIEGEGPSTPGEYMKAGHVAQAVVDDIASWIAQH